MRCALIAFAGWLAIAGACKGRREPAADSVTAVVAPAPREVVAPDAAAGCSAVDLVPVDELAAGCRAGIAGAAARVVRVARWCSGTLVSTAAARGGGLVATCQHCLERAPGGLTAPSTPAPPPIDIDLAGQRLTAQRVFAPQPPAAAYDARDRLTTARPADDFTLAVITDLASEVAVREPSRVPFHSAPVGARVVLLGYPVGGGGQLYASVGPILDAATARDRLARADADEAALPYDADSELVVAARAMVGMSGGGAFAEDGRFLGVIVRGTVAPVDGAYLVRVVRAPYLAAQLSAALARASAAVRAEITPWLP